MTMKMNYRASQKGNSYEGGYRVSQKGNSYEGGIKDRRNTFIYFKSSHCERLFNLIVSVYERFTKFEYTFGIAVASINSATPFCPLKK